MCAQEINFDLANKQNRLHLLNGLASILLDIDKAIRIIRETDTDADVIPISAQALILMKCKLSM